MAATGKTPILLYGSTTPTNAPTAGNLTNSTDGCEIAINVADKNLFFKDSTNAVNTVPIRQSSASSNGWLSSTDWNTFNNKQPAGTYVTSVTGTSPLVSSGGTTPAISMAAANGSTNGYLTSTDWNTFNGKAPAFTYTSNYIPYGQGTTTPTQSAAFTFNGTTLNVGTGAATQVVLVNGAATGTGAGAYLLAQNNGSSTIGIGNKSALLGGAYDATSFVYFPTTLQFGSSSTPVATMFTSGGVSIGNTTDPGAKNLSVSGNGLFGTTTNTYGSAVTAKSNGDNVAGQFYRQGTGVGTAIVLFSSNATATESLRSYIDTSTGALTVLSDESLKENLVPITDAINKVKSLRSYIGNYIGDESKHPFLIAQDVQKALPEAVSKSPTGKLGLSYSEVIPLLVAAFNEQQMLIEALQKKLGE